MKIPRLPNFYTSTPPMAAFVAACRWGYVDLFLAWLLLAMFILYAFTAFCDVMANHYRTLNERLGDTRNMPYVA